MEKKMKKFVDYIMTQPVWKVVLYGLGILFMIFNPKIILPILFFGGIGFAWYFAKKKPNAAKRNIAAIASVLAVGGAYLVNPNIASTKPEEQAQATHFASTPSKNDESAKKEAEAKREKEAKEKAEKEKAEKAEKEKAEKAEKEKKAKEEQERKEKEEREKKAKEEQERKEKEEREKKEAEAKQLAAQAEAAVQALENNQVTENIAPAQAAIANVADQGTKDRLTHRVGLVQNAITVREQQAAEAERARQAAAAEQARQATAAQQAQQQQAFVTQPQQGGYRNCSEARAAGAAPLYRGQAGYSSRLDRDGDGVACE